MSNLINKLEEKGLLTDHLVLPKISNFIYKKNKFYCFWTGPHGTETYMGIAQVENGLHRRIDIK